nr:MAG TPA: hypothetical protein [Caudoviricetes sp.]
MSCRFYRGDTTLSKLVIVLIEQCKDRHFF